MKVLKPAKLGTMVRAMPCAGNGWRNYRVFNGKQWRYAQDKAAALLLQAQVIKQEVYP